MNSGLQPLRVTVAAGAEDSFNVAAGRFVAFKEASAGAFEIALADGPFVPWDGGMAYQIPDAATPFSVLRVRNLSANPITFQILVGTGRVYDQRLTVVATRIGDSLALDGADGTGISAPDGGSGIRGFLSGIYDRLKATGPLGAILSNLETLGTAILTGVGAISLQLPTNIGPTTRAGSLSVTPGTLSGSIVSIQTAAVGTDWTAFGALACLSLEIVNSTATALEYRRNGSGGSIQIAAGASRVIAGIANANEISVRRVDTSNTQVTVTAETLS